MASSGARFAGWSLLAGVGNHFNDLSGTTSLSAFTDCRFAGGKFTIYQDSAALTNCLWERVYVSLDDHTEDRTWYLYNNLFLGGTLYFRACADAPVLEAYNNLFDGTTLAKGSSGTEFTHGYNGYVTNQNRLTPTNTHDVVLTNSPAYHAGSLGRFYYPTNDGILSRLINVGSVTNTASVGLYHYTTTTNQVKETNSTVDIGFHFVAADASGNPLASYWSDLPDYLSDTNGELAAWLMQKFGHLGVDSGDDPDGDWSTNLQEYQAGSNPADTMLVAWGDNGHGQCKVPSDLRNVAALAGGLFHTVVSTSNGTAVAWGDNATGQTNIPPGLSNVIALAAGEFHSLALRADGTVTNWGYWQGLGGYHITTVPQNLSNIIALAAGKDHDIALRSDGSVIVWGYDTNQPYNLVPDGLTNVAAIAAGWEHNVALLNNSTVVGWGQNYTSFGWNVATPPAGLTNVVAIAAGGYHTLALRSDGTVVAWGAGNGTNLSLNYLDEEKNQSVVPTGLSNVVAIAAGDTYSLALRNDGTFVAWGDNGLGQTNGLPGLNHLVRIAAGPQHGLAVRAGRLTPLIFEQPSNQVDIPGTNVTFSALGFGLASVHYQWQFNGVNLTGQTNATLTLTSVSTNNEGNYHVTVSTGAGSVTSSVASFTILRPPQIVSVAPAPAAGIWLTNYLTLSVAATNGVQSVYPITYQWKVNGTNLSYAANSSNYIVVPSWLISSNQEGSYSVSISNAAGGTNVGSWFIRALEPGTVATWGNNAAGQCDRPTFLTDAVALAAGESHSVAVRENGSVVQWGTNWGNIPENLTNAVVVAAGARHTLALRNDGTVVAWGSNDVAQTNVPDALTNKVAVAAGGNQSLALLRDGTVTNWGASFGTIPGNLTNAAAIACGSNFCVALRSNGTVVAWGANADGRTNVPASATNAVAIAVGGGHSLALKSNGTVVAWGLNYSNQTNVPSGLSNVVAIAAGGAHSLALQNDGTVVAWGGNGSGQRDVLTNLPPVKLIAAGGSHTLAAIFSPTVLYPVDVSKEVMLIYNSNTNAPASSNVWYHYMQHRPMITGANVLALNCQPTEEITTNEFASQLLSPLSDWSNANPTKRLGYIILFPYIPQLVTNESTGELLGSASALLRNSMPGTKPFITCISMTNEASCIAYINKLGKFGTNPAPGKLFISASALAYSNTNFYFDAVLEGGDGTQYNEQSARDGVLFYGASTSAVFFAGPNDVRITNAVNVAGYLSEGAHGWQRQNWATNRSVVFTGDSGWYIMTTDESYNGAWYGGVLNGFNTWFSSNALGGTNYSNTPVGAVCHVFEPGNLGVNAGTYYGLWQAGRSFAACAWVSAKNPSPMLQAIGDPFVRR